MLLKEGPGGHFQAAFDSLLVTFLETVDHEPIEVEGPTAAMQRGVNNCSVHLESEVILFISLKASSTSRSIE